MKGVKKMFAENVAKTIVVLTNYIVKNQEETFIVDEQCQASIIQELEYLKQVRNTTTYAIDKLEEILNL